MSANTVHEARHALLIRSQEAWLQQNGCVIRHTFIDLESHEVEDSVLPRHRSQSLPPRLNKDIEPQRQQEVQKMRTPTRCPMQLSLFDSLRCADTETSPASSGTPTTPRSVCSELVRSPCSDSMSTACSETDGQMGVTERVHELAHIISEECGFMRVQGHRVLLAEGLPGLRSKNVATICVFVQGLPWTKRAKWRYPLLRSAAQALERVQVDAVVTGGNLFVSLPRVGRVQLDFAAAR